MISTQTEQLFMEEMSELVSLSDTEKHCFEVCYNRKNKGLNAKILANILNKKEHLNGTITTVRLYQIRTDVARKIKKKFEPEMRADIGERVDLIKEGKIGRCSRGKPPKGDAPYQVASDWLWKYYFPRWGTDKALQSLIAKADRSSDWISFNSVNQNKEIGGSRKIKDDDDKIEVNSSYFMSIILSINEGHFLLLNRGKNTRYFICPSLAFAPRNKVNIDGILMPQEEAILEDIFFDEICKEEFIGIQVDKPFDLEWLKPTDKESIPTCTPERINRLLDGLKETKYKVFYKSFSVVEQS